MLYISIDHGFNLVLSPTGAMKHKALKTCLVILAVVGTISARKLEPFVLLY